MPKIRAAITKGEELRYISHLDYAAAIERAVRRAKLPVAYSEGFNPHMKLAFASALAVGITSDAEYVDIEFKEVLSVESFCQQMHKQLPKGIKILAAKALLGKQPALMALVDLAVYEAKLKFHGDFSKIEQALQDFSMADEVTYLRHTPKGKKEIEVKQYIKNDIQAKLIDNVVYFNCEISVTSQGSIKPGEVFKVLIDQFKLPIAEDELLINRRGLYVKGKTPLEC